MTYFYLVLDEMANSHISARMYPWGTFASWAPFAATHDLSALSVVVLFQLGILMTYWELPLNLSQVES